MKVLAINLKTVMMSAIVIVLLLVSIIAIMFKDDKNAEQLTPEVEIVLPEGVSG